MCNKLLRSSTVKLKTLSTLHAAALQLIGEKEEELNDSKQDLEECKQVCVS